MPEIAILATERCQASSLHIILDIFIAANQVAKAYLGDKTSPFTFKLIGLKKKITAYNQSCIDNIQPIDPTNKPDIAIIPGAFEASVTEKEALDSLQQYRSVISTLDDWHQQGVLLASACTGNFILAKTEALKGRDITCHWAFSNLACKLFPKESFRTNKLLIDHGDIISAGGATTVAQLVLYLIARVHSRELAQITAKIMLIEISFEQQSRFAIFSPNHKHNDEIVLKLQNQLEKHFSEAFDIHEFASQNALSEKQIVRRFKRATNETPLSYLQKIRIEKVKLALESGARSINKTIWDVGYEDTSSFRRLFKKATGLTMQEYRSRFSRLEI